MTKIRTEIIYIACATLIAVGLGGAALLMGRSLAQVFASEAIGSALLLVLSLRHRKYAREKDGWLYLTPPASDWVALLGSGACALALIYVYLFVGSTRRDAAQQMQYVLWLITACGVIGLYVGWRMVFTVVRWNDEEVQYRSPWLRVTTLHWSDLGSVTPRRASDFVILAGNDGRKIPFSMDWNGSESLLGFVSALASSDKDDD